MKKMLHYVLSRNNNYPNLFNSLINNKYNKNWNKITHLINK
jgi:hypothetical protein